MKEIFQDVGNLHSLLERQCILQDFVKELKYCSDYVLMQ